MKRIRLLRNQHSFAFEALDPRLLLSAYFVAPGGDDSAAGTAAAPWQTLQQAADTVQAGDVVTVEPGTYAGFIMGWDNPQNGTAVAPITFSAQPGAIITSRNNETEDGIDLEGSSYITIQGFTITNDGSITRAGIRSVGYTPSTPATNVIIENNNVSGMGDWGIFTAFSNNLLIQNNTAADSQNQHGIYVSNSPQNPKILDNTVYGNADCGIQINADVTQGGTGICHNALIAGNVVHDNGGSGINLDGVQNSLIENNLLYNNHASGVALFQEDGGGPSINNVVVNNTIVEASDARWCVNINTNATGNTVYNNILDNENSGHGAITITADSLSGFTSDYNIIINNQFSPDDESTFLNLAQWQRQTGLDSHSKLSTEVAVFVNAGGSNFHLAAGSPAIDAGTAAGAPAADLEGNPRPSGAGYDIGAYELPQPLTSNQRYVTQLYSDLLHRAADATGLQIWTAMLNGGTARATVAASIASSREYDGDIIDGFYVTYLGRHADPGGLTAWVNQMQSGQSADAILAGILGSDEYFARTGGTNASYVTALYQSFLNRDPDAGGFQAWTSLLNTNQQTHAQVATAFANSDEHRSVTISELYRTLLQRAPDTTGLANWMQMLTEGMTQPQIITQFVTAPEYLALNGLA